MTKTLSALAFILGLAALPLTAQGSWGGKEHGRGLGMRHPFARLNLSEAQQASLKGLHEQHKASMEAKAQAVREAQATLRKAMADPKTSEADLKTLHEKASQARFAAVLERRTLMQESLALLTPEQKAQWEKQRAERMEHKGRPGRGHGRGRPMGPDGCPFAKP
jgi:Spy/CpxP family protein refolding chaperone